MTSSPHSRTTTELATTVEAGLQTWGHRSREVQRGTEESPWWVSEHVRENCEACDAKEALAELRSRAEQQRSLLICPYCAHAFEPQENRTYGACPGCDRAEAAERERDHMRATLERIVSAYSDENEEFLADTVFTTARDALSQPGNTQP